MVGEPFPRLRGKGSLFSAGHISTKIFQAWRLFTERPRDTGVIRRDVQGVVVTKFMKVHCKEREGQESGMRKSTLIGFIVLLLAASFASASSVMKPADSDEDFCFGYAICE